MSMFGHTPVVPPRIGRSALHVPDSVLNRFRDAYLPDISDAVGALYTMTPEIRQLYVGAPPIVGRALTVKAPPGDNLTVHGALARVHPGDVLVIDWRGYTAGCATGAGSLIAPIEAGLVGAIVDGGWRDVGEVRALRFPVYARAVAAFSPPKARIGEINVPVACGGVVVNPGDVVVADEEGIAVVPAAEAASVADALRSYTPRKRLEDWPVDELRLTAAERARMFAVAFAAAGGLDDGNPDA